MANYNVLLADDRTIQAIRKADQLNFSDPNSKNGSAKRDFAATFDQEEQTVQFNYPFKLFITSGKYLNMLPGNIQQDGEYFYTSTPSMLTQEDMLTYGYVPSTLIWNHQPIDLNSIFNNENIISGQFYFNIIYKTSNVVDPTIEYYLYQKGKYPMSSLINVAGFRQFQIGIIQTSYNAQTETRTNTVKFNHKIGSERISFQTLGDKFGEQFAISLEIDQGQSANKILKNPLDFSIEKIKCNGGKIHTLDNGYILQNYQTDSFYDYNTIGVSYGLNNNQFTAQIFVASGILSGGLRLMNLQQGQQTQHIIGYVYNNGWINVKQSQFGDIQDTGSNSLSLISPTDSIADVLSYKLHAISALPFTQQTKIKNKELSGYIDYYIAPDQDFHSDKSAWFQPEQGQERLSSQLMYLKWAYNKISGWNQNEWQTLNFNGTIEGNVDPIWQTYGKVRWNDSASSTIWSKDILTTQGDSHIILQTNNEEQKIYISATPPTINGSHGIAVGHGISNNPWNFNLSGITYSLTQWGSDSCLQIDSTFEDRHQTWKIKVDQDEIFEDFKINAGDYISVTGSNKDWTVSYTGPLPSAIISGDVEVVSNDSWINVSLSTIAAQNKKIYGIKLTDDAYKVKCASGDTGAYLPDKFYSYGQVIVFQTNTDNKIIAYLNQDAILPQTDGGITVTYNSSTGNFSLASEGKTKINSSDSLGYLADKIQIDSSLNGLISINISNGKIKLTNALAGNGLVIKTSSGWSTIPIGTGVLVGNGSTINFETPSTCDEA